MRVFRLCGQPFGSRRRRCHSRRCTIAKAQVLRGERAGLTVAERHRDLVEASAIDGSQLRDARLEYRRVALVQGQVPLQPKVRIHHISGRSARARSTNVSWADGVASSSAARASSQGRYLCMFASLSFLAVSLSYLAPISVFGSTRVWR